MQIVAFLTSEWFFIALSVFLLAYLVYKKRNKLAFEFLSGSIILSIIITVIKNIFKIPRPDNLLIQVSGYSFPSWHSGYIVFLAIFIYLIFIKNVKKTINKAIFILSLIFFVLFIGFTRIWFNVHTIKDVFWGYLISFILTLFILLIFNKINKKH